MHPFPIFERWIEKDIYRNDILVVPAKTQCIMFTSDFIQYNTRNNSHSHSHSGNSSESSNNKANNNNDNINKTNNPTSGGGGSSSWSIYGTGGRSCAGVFECMCMFCVNSVLSQLLNKNLV